ncbi:ALP1-like protein isoform X1 [Tanacetum coccineum]
MSGFPSKNKLRRKGEASRSVHAPHGLNLGPRKLSSLDPQFVKFPSRVVLFVNHVCLLFCQSCPTQYQRVTSILMLDNGGDKNTYYKCLKLSSQDLWIWQCFLWDDAGANNDINVLDNSPLFDDLLDDLAPVVPYVVNGVQYRNGYYLADGIYPEWASFVKSFTVATDPKHTYFKQRQESARKDVERAFGVLQGRWGLIQQPARAYEVNTLRRIMYAGIIMHNMILEDQNMSVVDWKHVYSNPARSLQTNEEIKVENEIRAGNEKLEETEREGDDIQISNDEFAPETNQFHEFYKSVSKGNNDEYNGRNVDNVTPLLDVVMTMVRMQALVDDEDVLLNSAFELRMQALVNNEDVLVNSALELSASANSKEDNVNSSKDGNIEHRRVNNRLINQGTMAGVDVDTLTMKQYLALSRENKAPGVVKPKIGGNVNFKIKSQFMRELREDSFSGKKTRMLTITLIGSSASLAYSIFLKYYPPSLTAKQLEDIYNFKQEGDESLYQAWERYNDMLYKCPTYDINSHQKVNIFYKGLSTMNRQLFDSHGPIPGMRPAQALTAIQTMAGHSQKWHEGMTSMSIRSSGSNDGRAALVNKLETLGRDMKKLKESVYAIQVGCQICEGPHLDKDCPLNKEVKQVEEVRYGEFGRTTPFNGNNGGKFRVGPPGYYTKTDNHTPYV